MFKIIDSFKYISNILVPVPVLPSNICKCTANQVKQLCAAFPQDLEDPDMLLAEMEVIGGSIEKSGAKNLREDARLLKDKLLFHPNLMKAYQLALTIPILVASNERSFSKLRLVKSYLRSTMKEDHLDTLTILASSPDILDI